VSRASARERTQRVNMALDLLKKKTAPPEVAAALAARFNLSARQAYRYVQHAQRVAKPLALPEPKAVFTVKLPPRLIQRVRRRARARGQPISQVVTEALQQFLTQPNRHG
jgi:predicted DNA binding CopG/RHH family protein